MQPARKAPPAARFGADSECPHRVLRGWSLHRNGGKRPGSGSPGRLVATFVPAATVRTWQESAAAIVVSRSGTGTQPSAWPPPRSPGSWSVVRLRNLVASAAPSPALRAGTDAISTRRRRADVTPPSMQVCCSGKSCLGATVSGASGQGDGARETAARWRHAREARRHSFTRAGTEVICGTYDAHSKSHRTRFLPDKGLQDQITPAHRRGIDPRQPRAVANRP